MFYVLEKCHSLIVLVFFKKDPLSRKYVIYFSSFSESPRWRLISLVHKHFASTNFNRAHYLQDINKIELIFCCSEIVNFSLPHAIKEYLVSTRRIAGDKNLDIETL